MDYEIDNFNLPVKDGPAPQVLVLLACKNGERWIAEQIDSVLSQVEVDVRILIRDDGSIDDTIRIIKSIKAKDSRVSLINDFRALGGAAANFFQLIREADVISNEFVAFCDQDDIWFPDKLIRGVRMCTASGCGGYSSAVKAMWPGGSFKILSQSTHGRKADFLFEGAGQGCTFLLTSELFRVVKEVVTSNSTAISNIHYHDWAVFAVARAKGVSWFFDRSASMIYRQHEGNDTGARFTLSGVRKRWAAIVSGWYREQVCLIVNLVRLIEPKDIFSHRWDALNKSRPHLIKDKALFVFRFGRRRLSDRLILIFAVLLGYL